MSGTPRAEFASVVLAPAAVALSAAESAVLLGWLALEWLAGRLAGQPADVEGGAAETAPAPTPAPAETADTRTPADEVAVNPCREARSADDLHALRLVVLRELRDVNDDITVRRLRDMGLVGDA